MAIEVKSTSTDPILMALRQMHARATPGEIPVGIWRPNGYGPEKFHDWVFFCKVGTFLDEIAPRSGWFIE